MTHREAMINQAHVVNASSAAIQAIVAEVLTGELQFIEEVVLTCGRPMSRPMSST